MAAYENSLRILEQEGELSFRPIQQHWRPKNLLFIRQCQLLLKDAGSRYDALELAYGEFVTLPYADKYIKYLKRMRLWLRDANFSWRADQLEFLKSITGFYTDYGAVLRLLRIDQLRGAFADSAALAVTNKTGV